MIKYTSIQAGKCKVDTFEALVIDNVHQYYRVSITDENGFMHEWTNYDLKANATKAQIKTTISDYLTSIEKPTPEPVEVVTQNDAIVGKKVNEL